MTPQTATSPRARSRAGDRLERESAVLNGVEIAYHDAGDRAAPVILLLHGFPDSADLWRHQIPPLVEAGYRVVAPDLRGFGDSAKPQEIDDYLMPKLVNDVVALTTSLGITKAHVVGHDWGAAIAWMYAFLMPRRVDRLIVLSVGHPGTFENPTIEAREKTWYMLYYQFPGVSEKLLRQGGWRLFKQIIGGEGDQTRYLRDLAKPGALTAGLNLYRANRSPESELRTGGNFPPVLAPTLGIWSDGDKAMVEDAMTASEKYVKGTWRYQRVEGASHWIPLDAPDTVTDAILGFVADETCVSAQPTTRRRRL